MTVTASASDAVAFLRAVLPAFSSILRALKTPSVSMRPTTSSFFVSVQESSVTTSSGGNEGLTVDTNEKGVVNVA